MAAATVLTRDRPALWWFLALLFFTVACCFLYLGISQGSEIPVWQAALISAMGVAGIAGGLWVLAHAPLSTVTLDPIVGELTITRLGLMGRTVLRYPVGQLAGLAMLHQHDDDGYAMTRPALVLATGETVLLSVLWRHGTTDADRAINGIAAVIPHLTLTSGRTAGS